MQIGAPIRAAWQVAVGPYQAMVHHAFLILQLTRRDVAARYRGSFIGIFWAVLTPLLSLLVYTFVFGVVFQTRNPLAEGKVDTYDFAKMIFVGIALHMFFSECLNRAPTLLLSNSNFVTKIKFPIEVLPIILVCTNLFTLVISLVLLAVIHALTGTLSWTVCLVPILLLPFLVLALGLSWLFAAIGVFIRDANHIIGPFVTVLIFMGPIFYPMGLVPEAIRTFFWFNPLTVPVETVRAVLLMGEPPDWGLWCIYLACAFSLTALTYRLFLRLKRAFADVL